MPLTAREYAYVHITGPGTHEQVTEILGMRPSDSWNVGDTNVRNGRPYRSMSWELKSGLDDTHPLDQHIKELLVVLGTRAHRIRELWVEYDLTLQCVGYYLPTCHGMHFDREQVRQAAQLGLCLDLDFYYLDDRPTDA